MQTAMVTARVEGQATNSYLRHSVTGVLDLDCARVHRGDGVQKTNLFQDIDPGRQGLWRMKA